MSRIVIVIIVINGLLCGTFCPKRKVSKSKFLTISNSPANIACLKKTGCWFAFDLLSSVDAGAENVYNLKFINLR
jgi:hypothetical protein